MNKKGIETTIKRATERAFDVLQPIIKHEVQVPIGEFAPLLPAGDILGPHTPTIATNKTDMVNYPPHYRIGKIEVIDFIENKELGWHEGNVVKYVCRAKHKGAELQDLEKAAWYLNRKIKALKEANDPRTNIS